MTNEAQSLKPKYDLEERTAKFAEMIIDLGRSVHRDPVTSPLVSQLVRAASSIGANYAEADAACSKKDFKHKIALCKKEARETRHWLRLLAKAEPECGEPCRRFWQEAQELTLIFSAILRK